MIKLKEIDRNNFEDVIKLSVFEEQKNFVASNIFSLAQAKAQPECVPLAIYHDKDLVGFVMYALDTEDKEYWIYRLMIDKRYQKMGYGRAVMQSILDRIASHKPNGKVYLSFDPANTVAKKLYEDMGFIADGRIIEGEVVYCLK